MEILKFIFGNLIGFFILYQGDRGIWYQVCLLKTIPYKGKLVAEDVFRNQKISFLSYYKIAPLLGTISFVDIALFSDNFILSRYAAIIAGIWLAAFVTACLALSLRSFNVYAADVARNAE